MINLLQIIYKSCSRMVHEEDHELQNDMWTGNSALRRQGGFD